MQGGHTVLLEFPNFTCRFTGCRLRHNRVPRYPALVYLVPNLFFSALPTRLVSNVGHRLLRRSPLYRAASRPRKVRRISFAVMVHRPLSRLHFLRTGRVAFFLRVLRRNVTLFFSVDGITRQHVTLVGVGFARLPHPIRGVLVRLTVSDTRVQWATRRQAGLGNHDARHHRFMDNLFRPLLLISIRPIARSVGTEVGVQVTPFTRFVTRDTSSTLRNTLGPLQRWR